MSVTRGTDSLMLDAGCWMYNQHQASDLRHQMLVCIHSKVAGATMLHRQLFDVCRRQRIDV